MTSTCRLSTQKTTSHVLMDECQYVLRLPEPLVSKMRFALSSSKRRDAAGDGRSASVFSVDFKDERNAVFTVDNVDYPAYLMDLPCIVETHKTADKRTFYKSGDLHQVLVVRLPNEPPPDSPALMDGLTPGAKEAGRRLRAPEKVFRKEDVAHVEQRIKYVIDHKITFVAKKDDSTSQPHEEEVVIEDDAPAVEEMSEAVKSASVDKGQVMQDTIATPVDSILAPSPGMPSPAADTPGPGETPGPEGEEEEDEEDGDDEDDDDEDDDAFASMAGELMEEEEDYETRAKKHIERVNLDKKIAEQKDKISGLEEKAAKAPNHVLKNRVIAKMGELREELVALETSRAKLGN